MVASSAVNKVFPLDLRSPFVISTSLANETTSFVRHPLPTDDSDVAFQLVINKKAQDVHNKSKDIHASHAERTLHTPTVYDESVDNRIETPSHEY